MQYKRLFSPYQLKEFHLKNRIYVPPLTIRSFTDDSGLVTDRHLNHYRTIAEGGAGLVIQEATAVSRNGRLSLDQLGIWDDGQIEGLQKIVNILHSAGMPAILQLSHAGLLAAKIENQIAPSGFRYFDDNTWHDAREMTLEEIHLIEQQFIYGAKRAAAAGYDGVELHASHGYLLSTFLNRQINRREDDYGGDGTLILKNIIRGIRKIAPGKFIIGCRIGAFEPELEDGLSHAQWLEENTFDFIDVYLGCEWASRPYTPDKYPFSPSVYGAECFKQVVSIPVFAAHQIRTGADAESILQNTGVDMVAIGRGTLVNHHWGNDVRAGRDAGLCLNCKTCMWESFPEKCPGRLRLNQLRHQDSEEGPACIST